MLSSQAFSVSLRPLSFDQVIGQDVVVNALSTSISSQRLHHAYLFTGTRGVGKTTIARLLAKSINCETGITATPCGECKNCKSIALGKNVDVLEVDGASQSKVDDIRAILENIPYAPTNSRFKIYIIDEVHQLSKPAFDALLKTLEEPPAHVKFILATTESKKLPATILSRCLQFQLKNIPTDVITSYLLKVSQDNGFSAEPKALQMLSITANGSLRDALTIFEVATALCSDQITEIKIANFLNGTTISDQVNLLRALLNKDVKNALEIAFSFAQYDPDYFALTKSCMGILHRVSINQLIPDMYSESFDAEDINSLSTNYSNACVCEVYKNLFIASRDFSYSHNPKETFLMLIIRVSSFHPAIDITTIANEDDSNSTPNLSHTELNSSAASECGLEDDLLVKNNDITQPLAMIALKHHMELTESLWESLSQSFSAVGDVSIVLRHSRLIRAVDQGVELGLISKHFALLDNDVYQNISNELSTYFGYSVPLIITEIQQ